MAIMETLLVAGAGAAAGYYIGQEWFYEPQPKIQSKAPTHYQKDAHAGIRQSEFYPVSTNLPTKRPESRRRYVVSPHYFNAPARQPDTCLKPDYVYDAENHRYTPVCLPY